MEKLYYSSTLMWGASPQQILFRAARAGVAGLEIWAQQADTFGWQPEMLGELARRAGLKLLVHAKSWDLNFAALNEGVRRASVEELKRSLEFASRCGAGEMTLHPPHFTLPGLKARAMESGARGLEELLDTAESLGIEISLEVMEKLPKELVTTPEGYRAFAGDLLPRLSCTLDLAHCQNEGEFWEYLSRLPRISKLHISNKQGKKLHTPLAQGDFNFLWLMPRLQKLDLPLVIEGFDGDGRFEILKSDLELCQIQEEKDA